MSAYGTVVNDQASPLVAPLHQEMDRYWTQVNDHRCVAHVTDVPNIIQRKYFVALSDKHKWLFCISPQNLTMPWWRLQFCFYEELHKRSYIEIQENRIEINNASFTLGIPFKKCLRDSVSVKYFAGPAKNDFTPVRGCTIFHLCCYFSCGGVVAASKLPSSMQCNNCLTRLCCPFLFTWITGMEDPAEFSRNVNTTRRQWAQGGSLTQKF